MEETSMKSTFPVSTQKDLLLSGSVNWSSNTQQIIENDEKEFEGNDLILSESLMTNMNNPNMNTNDKHLNMSWGNYFAKKSPPLGDLCGSHGVQSSRPQFDHNDYTQHKYIQHKYTQQKSSASELISENNNKIRHERHEIKEEENENNINNNNNNNNNMCVIEEETENEEMVITNIDDDININKALENIDFKEFNSHYLSNRDSKDSQKSDGSTDSQLNKLIQIPKLKYIQRFYQFTVNENVINTNTNNENILEQIKLCISKYIKSYTNNRKIKAYLSGITYKKEDNNNNICTVLILFDNHKKQNNNNDEWINYFLSYPAIEKILDKKKQNYFTQLCSQYEQ